MIFALRYVLPAAGVIAGLIVMALGSEAELEGGAGIVGASLAIYAVNWLYRAGVEGDREREREEAARVYFDEHGRWPDDSQRPRQSREPQRSLPPAHAPRQQG